MKSTAPGRAEPRWDVAPVRARHDRHRIPAARLAAAGSSLACAASGDEILRGLCHAGSVDRSNLFVGSRAKIARAASGCKELSDLARAEMMRRSGPSASVRKEDGWEVVHLYLPGFSAHLSVVLGEIGHNLRSALDYAIWDSVLACGNTPGTYTAFPICTTRKAYKAAVSPSPSKQGQLSRRGALAGLQPKGAIRAVVEKYQPFATVASGSEPRVEPLALLHAMWNVTNTAMCFVPSPPDRKTPTTSRHCSSGRDSMVKWKCST